QRVERGLVGARYFGLQLQMYRGDRVAALNLLERNLCRRVHLLRNELRFTENQRQCHRETAGVRYRDQFFRIAAFFAFEAAGETVRIGLESATLGGQAAHPVLESTFPAGRALSLDLHRESPVAKDL